MLIYFAHNSKTANKLDNRKFSIKAVSLEIIFLLIIFATKFKYIKVFNKSIVLS